MSDPRSVIPFDQLPDGFARTIEDEPLTPATPRPAATIVLLRDRASEDGMEVLLMRRSRRAGFVPGAYVFPGGRVDGSDATPEAMDLLADLTPEAAAHRLGLGDEADPPAIAYYLAALREAFEETGILVGERPDGSAPPTAVDDPAVDAVREDLMQDHIGLAEALTALDCRVDGDRVEYIAHWITPTPEPRRYDTRFFAAKVPPGTEAMVDPREMTEALWISPSQALDRCDTGDLPMVFPTIKTLEQLARYDSADAALGGIGGQEVRTILPTLVVTPTGVGLQIEDD